MLARVFVEHCISVKNETLLEAAALPVVTAFAFHMQESYNLLLEALEDLSEADEDEELEEELAKREAILGELLRVTLKLDYGDEIGRRKVFTVVSQYFHITDIAQADSFIQLGIRGHAGPSEITSRPDSKLL